MARGERHAIHPLGAEWAKNRGLYDPAIWAMVGFSQPEVRRGMAVLIKRNEYAEDGFDLTKVGTRVRHPDEGGDVYLTAEMVDAGLEMLHTELRSYAAHQHGVRSLRRCPAGSHGVWEVHLPVALYKILEAAAKVGLEVLITTSA